MQNKIVTSDTTFTGEVRKLNESFQQLNSDLAINKNVNSHLHNHFVNIERQCCANAQYSRRQCVEIVDIPSSVPDNGLEKPFENLSTTLELQTMIGLLNPAIVLAVKAVR